MCVAAVCLCMCAHTRWYMFVVRACACWYMFVMRVRVLVHVCDARVRVR